MCKTRHTPFKNLYYIQNWALCCHYCFSTGSVSSLWITIALWSNPQFFGQNKTYMCKTRHTPFKNLYYIQNWALCCHYHFSTGSVSSLWVTIALWNPTLNFLDKTRLTCVKQDIHLLKTLIISILELCAATIASQQDRYLRCELQLPCEIQLSVFWIDSTTVLKYVSSETKLHHTFVANRV